MHIQVSKFTSNLSPSVHVCNIASKANSRAVAIHHSFISRDVTLLIRAYKTYVRPLVESNTVIWSPTAIGYVDLLERVQRKFTKKLFEMQNLPYTERLKHLNLDSLELWRLHVDLMVL